MSFLVSQIVPSLIFIVWFFYFTCISSLVFYVYTNRLFYLVYGYLLFYSSFYRPLLFYAGSLALALSRVFPLFLFPLLSIFSYLVFFDVFNWVSSRTSSFPYSQSSSFLLIFIILVNPRLTPELAQDPAISLDLATKIELNSPSRHRIIRSNPSWFKSGTIGAWSFFYRSISLSLQRYNLAC